MLLIGPFLRIFFALRLPYWIELNILLDYATVARVHAIFALKYAYWYRVYDIRVAIIQRVTRSRSPFIIIIIIS